MAPLWPRLAVVLLLFIHCLLLLTLCVCGGGICIWSLLCNIVLKLGVLSSFEIL